MRRALPNRIRVEITERTPVAFLRDGSDLALVDVHGVILDRPLKAISISRWSAASADMPLDDREQRMNLFVGFMKEIGIRARRRDASRSARWIFPTPTMCAPRLPDCRSEFRRRGWQRRLGQFDAPILVHFGDRDFESKYRLARKYRPVARQQRAASIRWTCDSRQVVVNPDRAIWRRAIRRRSRRGAQLAAPAGNEISPVKSSATQHSAAKFGKALSAQRSTSAVVFWERCVSLGKRNN